MRSIVFFFYFFYFLKHGKIITLSLKARIPQLACKGFFIFSSLFFCYYHVDWGVIWCFNKYKIKKYLLACEFYGLVCLPIVLKLGPARWVDPGIESGRVEEKIRKEKTRCDPADSAGWPNKTWLQTCWLFLFY